MADLGRRDFLRLIGLAGTTAAIGCSSESARRLIPYITEQEDLIPGQATWYATTCRECPAGCGLLAKNRDGRVIKVEGNPLHPINRGKLCARGQASVQGLYNPDRFREPMQKNAYGDFDPISWEMAEELLVARLSETLDRGRGDRIVFMSDLMTGTLKDLVAFWLAELGSKQHLVYEPLAYEPLRKANQIVFGIDGIPAYRIDQADFLISFGAGFLETWLSNVEYAGQFAQFRTPSENGKPFFVHVGPRLSLTAANADHWIPVAPGDEVLVAVAMLQILIQGELLHDLGAERKAAISSMIAPVPMQAILERTGLEEETLRDLAAAFARAKRPLALAEGLSFTAPNATPTAVAANLLSTLCPATRELIRFEQLSAYGQTARAEKMQQLSERMKRGQVEVLLIHNANPMFSLPASWDFQSSLRNVPLIVSLSSAADETSKFAHLVLPTHTPLESWGDYAPREGIAGLMQPVMGPVFHTRHLGDLLIATGKKLKGTERFPWDDFFQVLRHAWQTRAQQQAPRMPSELFWQQVMQQGGLWQPPESTTPGPTATPSAFSLDSIETTKKPENSFHFTTYPTVQFFDGRGASRPWLQELPDPISMITYGSWAEIHLQTARRLGLRTGDLVVLRSPYGTVEVPVFPLPSVPPDTVALPIGQGHVDSGRFADIQYGNPMHLLPPDIDGISGGIQRPAFTVTLARKDRVVPMAHTDGSLYQHDRGFVRIMDLQQYRDGKAAGHQPHLYLPLPQGYDSKRDFYPAHDHVDYRWSMVVDLDRCIGCGACVVACYSENNVAIVGKEQILKGREMSWLRVQRYFEPDRPVARFLPMLCQHCDNAPCESVCPVYAPHHSKEGLNNQVYNRCIGTRFCAQNCPYKVRRFNWFTFTRPEPLNWQLNPDVTVRQKGVMEKCSFCVQRIIEAKHRAREHGRKVQDGDFTTACAQTCPADALIFGNLMDPQSRVSQLLEDYRAYQVLDYLNTKPAVIYLKRLTQECIRS